MAAATPGPDQRKAYPPTVWTEPIRGHRFVRGFDHPLREFPALDHLNEAKVGPDYHLPPHRHAMFELSYIVSGTALYGVGREVHRLRAGDLFITRPGELHHGTTDPQDPHHNIALGLDPRALPLVGGALGEPAADVAAALGEADAVESAARALGARVIRGARALEPLLWRLFDEIARPRPAGGRMLHILMVQTLLLEVLLETTRCYAANLSGSRALPGARGRREIREVADWMSTRLRDPPSLAAMARQAGLSPGHFATVFRQEIGASPLEHLTTLRIDEAARRLSGPRPPSVTELAHELGFSSSQYFSVVFREAEAVRAQRLAGVEGLSARGRRGPGTLTDGWRHVTRDMTSDTRTTDQPIHALSAAERLHLELDGYVVVEGLHSAAHIERMRERLYGFERSSLAGEAMAPGMYVSETKHDYFRVNNLAHVDPCFLEHFTHPRLVGMAREVIGYDVRLHSSDAQIRRSGSVSYRHYFHRDTQLDLRHYANGLYHFPWIKALTMLSDVGPDDGGTCFIPGTHKLDPGLDTDDVIAAAEDDPRMIHRIVGSAGTTVIFFESLLHSPGINRSGRDRSIIIAGYLPITTAPSAEFTVPPGFVATLAEPRRSVLSSDPSGTPQPRFTTLPRRRPAIVALDEERGKPAVPTVDYKTIRFVRAAFGIDDRTVDVMPLIRRIAAGEQLLISFLTAGDPAPQTFKKTYLEWTTAGGARRSAVYDEGQVIHLDDLVAQG